MCARMKIIIAGGRDFNDFQMLCQKCDKILINCKDIQIVSGGANGADRLGERYAAQKGYGIQQFLANWTKYGKSAGYIRNKEMADYADALIAFWDQKSKGTGHMINIAKKQNLLVRVVVY